MDANQADAQYTERNKLDLAVPIRPLANIVKGLQLSILLKDEKVKNNIIL